MKTMKLIVMLMPVKVGALFPDQGTLRSRCIIGVEKQIPRCEKGLESINQSPGIASERRCFRLPGGMSLLGTRLILWWHIDWMFNWINLGTSDVSQYRLFAKVCRQNVTQNKFAYGFVRWVSKCGSVEQIESINCPNNDINGTRDVWFVWSIWPDEIISVLFLVLLFVHN